MKLTKNAMAAAPRPEAAFRRKALDSSSSSFSTNSSEVTLKQGTCSLNWETGTNFCKRSASTRGGLKVIDTYDVSAGVVRNVGSIVDCGIFDLESGKITLFDVAGEFRGRVALVTGLELGDERCEVFEVGLLGRV